MSKLQAKLASALALGVVVGAAATSLPQGAARAADNCLTEPKGDTQQGKHWYFHIERGTGRHCWYLRGQDDKAARADSGDAPAEKQPRRSEAAASRSVANAHAEIPPRAPARDDTSAPVATAAPAAPAAPSVWPNPQGATTTPSGATTNASPAPAPATDPSPLASRWPQASDTAAPAAAAQPDASLMVADAAPASDTAADSAPQAVPPPPLAAAPVERNTGSLQKLLLVAFGALALAGITGSTVYRLGRRRRRNDWLRERSNWQSKDNPLDPPWVGQQSASVSPAVPDLDEAREMISRAEVSEELEADESGDRVEKIEDFLARLTKQLQAELERPPQAEHDARASS